MKAKLLVVAVIIMAHSVPVSAQYDLERSNLYFGLKVGGGYSGISNVGEIIVSESYYTDYTLENSRRMGLNVGVFLSVVFPDMYFGIQPEVSFSLQGSSLKYSDINELSYTMDFKYSYLNVGLMLKAYPLRGLSVFAGPQVGFNLTPTNISYLSNNGDKYESPDIKVQQQLRNVLKGRTDFSLGVGLAYEFRFGLCVDFRYLFGISDVIETQVNSYKFIENSNTSQSMQLSVGYAIPFSGYESSKRGWR